MVRLIWRVAVFAHSAFSAFSAFAALFAASAGAQGARLTSAPPAPWSGVPLRAAEVPPAYRVAWAKAPNRRTCALLAFRSVDGGATARRAYFGGGWGVAYDRRGMRSAFGVAGTGVSAHDTTGSYHWPNTLRWADGSVAEYGPEGGTGPNQLAYLRVRGQGCLYNVWSRLGRAHLERLLGELRLVR
jgi:hypothetical protein